MNILLIYHDHAYLTLSLPDPTKSQSNTSIPRIPMHASAPGRKIRPRGGAGGAAAPHVASLAPNLCVHLFDLLCITAMAVLGLFPSR